MPNSLCARFKRYTTHNTTCLSIGVILFALHVITAACSSKSDATTADNTSPKFTLYYNKGEQLYGLHCSNCHQKTGTGLGLLYPPLNSSDFMDNNFEKVICLMKYGTAGEIIVNGKSYNKPMPGIPALSDLEIAEIATYIYNTWSHQKGLIDVKTVTPILANCQP